MLDRLPVLLPWLPLALAIPFAALCLYLVLALKREVRALTKRVSARPELEADIRRLSAELEELRSRLEDCQQPRASTAAWMPQPAAVNLNRRGQILRLHRKGKSLQEIAEILQVSHGEVGLMVKVHDISAVSGSLL
jgi:DNA-binding NarL/FixJ family response regulator